MKLSIITPYYKSYELTKRLAEHLEPQLTDDIEWIIVDDGCNERRLDEIKAKVVHLSYNSGNASVPRNLGLFYAKGDYITFIDSDDDVLENYIKRIMEKIEEGFDYCYLSWKYSNGEIKINSKETFWNYTVWAVVYRKEMIEGMKFDEAINYSEDVIFNKKLKPGKETFIDEPIYVYNFKALDHCLSNRFGPKKEKHTKRIIRSNIIVKRDQND